MFTILFGSQANGKTTPLSDTDIAIYTDKPLSYLDQGNLILGFEQRYKTKVDLVILNEVIDDNPSLSYDIMFHGKILQCNDYEQYNIIKYRVLQHYLDTAELRHHFMKEFEKRIIDRGSKKNDEIGSDN